MGRKLLASTRKSRGLKVLLLILAALCTPFFLAVPAHSQSSSPPVFPYASTVRLLDENSAPFLPIGDPISATDPNPGDLLTYSLSGKDADIFSIVETSGQLEAVRSLDYETGAAYSVAVRATDPAGLYDTISVNIEVTNVDEVGEIFLSQEMLNVGAELNAALTDPDGSISYVSWQWAVSIDKITWENIPGAESPYFSPTPEELSQYLRVRALYTDGHGPGKVAETLFATDLWSPGLNHPPEFPFSESGVRSVSPETPAGEPIGLPLLASDLDRDLLTYWLSGDASQLFVIGLHTGQLKTKSDLNSQLEGQHFGIVHVLDSRGGSASKTVRIDVGDGRVATVLPAAPVSPPVEEEDAATASLTPPEPDPSTEQSDSPEAPAALVSIPEPTPSSARVKPVYPAPTPASVSQGATQSAVEDNPATDAGHETLAALAAMIRPSPNLPEEGTSANVAGPTDGTGPAPAAQANGFESLFAWLAWSFLGVVLLAGILVVLMRTRRVKEREISLPPPTVGPERRIGPLPTLVSQSGDDTSANTGTDLVNPSRRANS